MKQSTGSYSTTLGQELQDLDAAYQKGLITEKEHKEAKKKRIEQRTESQGKEGKLEGVGSNEYRPAGNEGRRRRCGVGR